MANGRTFSWATYYANGQSVGSDPSISAFPAGDIELLAYVSWVGADGHGHMTFTDPVTLFVDQSGEVPVPAGNRSFSPDGAGVEDTTAVGRTLLSQGTVPAQVLEGDTVVRTLLDGETRNRGSHHVVTWDGLDDDADPLPAGEYVVRISSQGSDGTNTSGQVLREVDLRPVGSITAPAASATVGNLVHVAFTEGEVDLQGVRFCLLSTCADVTAPVDGVWSTDLDLGSVSTQTTALEVTAYFTDSYGTAHQWRPDPRPLPVDPTGLWVSAVFDPPAGPAPLTTTLLLDVDSEIGRAHV